MEGGQRAAGYVVARRGEPDIFGGTCATCDRRAGTSFALSGLPQNAVLAGSGPLLYLVAAQMIDAGCAPLALVETQTTRGMFGAMRHLPRAMFGAATLLKGLGLIAKIRRAGVPRYTAASDFRATAERNGDIRFSFRVAAEAR